MPVAAPTQEITLTPAQALPIYAVALCLLYAGIFVYRKMLRGVGLRGGYVRSDLFGLPDVIVVGILTVLLLLALALQWMFPTTAVGSSGLQIMSTVMLLSLPPILALLVARGVSIRTIFGLNRMGPLRVVGSAVGLVVLLLPLLAIVTVIAYQFLGGHAEQQEVVKTFREAAKAGKSNVIWNVILTATVFAPLAEEFLFRGYFYPVLKRMAGPVPAAVGISLLFGAVHNNAVGFPVLSILALALTLAYEWSGSILVPIFMHACFNTIMLALMWWQTAHGIAP